MRRHLHLNIRPPAPRPLPAKRCTSGRVRGQRGARVPRAIPPGSPAWTMPARGRGRGRGSLVLPRGPERADGGRVSRNAAPSPSATPAPRPPPAPRGPERRPRRTVRRPPRPPGPARAAPPPPRPGRAAPTRTPAAPRDSPRERSHPASPARPDAEARAAPPPATGGLARGVEPQAARDSPAGEREGGGGWPGGAEAPPTPPGPAPGSR